MSTQVRLYRALIRLYPRRFREAYGDDMVFVFEEMLRDRPAPLVWWRISHDAANSIVIQRLEPLMSRPSSRVAGIGAVLLSFVAVIALMVGGTNPAAFAATVAVAALGSAAAAVYWRANRGYVEPSTQLHQHWWKFLGSGVALLLAAIVAEGTFNIDGPWELLIATLLSGFACIAFGVVLGLWRGFAMVRRTGDNGAWPAS